MDVLDQEGKSVSRTSMSFPQRRCLVCGKDAKLCARSRAHSVEELQSRIAMLIDAYFRDKEADRFASCACRALLYEASVTPKPGLVDRCNSGSHTDMDFFTFSDSVSALPRGCAKCSAPAGIMRTVIWIRYLYLCDLSVVRRSGPCSV